MQGEIGRRAGGGVAGASQALFFGLGDASLGEVGQLEVVEEDAQKLVTREDEAKGVLLAVAAADLAAGAVALAVSLRALD